MTEMTLNSVSVATNPAQGLNHASCTGLLEHCCAFEDEVRLGGKLVQAQRRPDHIGQGDARPRQRSGYEHYASECHILVIGTYRLLPHKAASRAARLLASLPLPPPLPH